jgi:hypothetical protein
MATQKEVGKYCRDNGLYDKAKKSLCGFSNFQVFVDGDLKGLSEQAKKEGLEFYLLKGEMPVKAGKDGTTGDNV